MISRLAPRSGAAVLLALLLAVAMLAVPGRASAAGVSAEAHVVASTPTRLAVEVTGTGYSTEPPGIYVGLSESGGASAVDASVYRGTAYLTAAALQGGSFSVTLELDADDIATLDPERDYSVYTLKAHGAALTDPSQNAEVPVAVDFSTLADSQPEPEPTTDPDPEPTTDPDPEPTTEPEPATPSVTVSQREVSSQGATTVTVTGTGFDPSVATGQRPPLAGRAAGAYVVFGKFADTWRPSEGAASSTRVNSAQQWAVPAASMATIGGAPAGAIELTAEGSFTAELVIDKAGIDAKATSAALTRYGVYTYPGSGADAPSYETYTPIEFVEPEPVGPSLDVDVVEAVEGSLRLAVSGAGYLAEAPGVYLAIAPSGGASPTDASGYVGTQWVMHSSFGPGGTFERTLSLDADDIATLDPDVSYSVYTLRAHGLAATDPSQTVEVPLDVDVADLLAPAAPAGPVLDVEVIDAAEGRATIEVIGRGFAPTFPGVYVGVSEAGGADPADAGAYRGTIWVQAEEMDPFGGFTREIVLDADAIATLDPAASYAVYSLRAHGFADLDPSQSVEVPLDLDVVALQGGDDDPDPDPDPDPGTDPDPAPGGGDAARPNGSLLWGVKSSFRSYVTGPIANGTIAVSGGASSRGSAYRFFQRATNGAAAGDTTRFGGTVRFTGHDGELDLRFSDPSVVIGSTRAATLSVVVNGSRRDLATLDLSAATRSTKAGATTYTSAPARLTAAGAAAFDGFYAAGETLDPVAFTIGSDGGAASGGARTVASARPDTTDAFVPPAGPPSTTGATLDVDDPDAIEPGDRIAFSADGFAAGEQDVAVVVYSTPVVLDRAVSADSAGRVTWSGYLPGDLEPGEHTLTFQGSVDRGVTFTVSEGGEAVGRCSVDDATMTWGVKESFRSYVSGTIANGDWTTTGNASYATPDFTFGEGTGELDAADGSGDVAFDGAIEFTGHSGALAVTLADPAVRMVDDSAAVLLLDVTTGDRVAAQAGDTSRTTSEAVPFVELDLAGGRHETSEDGTITFSDVPTQLTEQGHGVFDDYAAGEAFDPVDLVVNASADCAGATAPVVETTDVVEATTGGDTGGGATWPWILVAALVVLAAAGGIVVGRRSVGART
jgi:hypothetical protein